MDKSKYAKLTNDKLDMISELENQLGVILIAYDPATNQIQEGNHASTEVDHSSSVINPS